MPEKTADSGEKMKQEEIKVGRKIVFAILFGTVISFFYAAGYLIETYDSLDLKAGSFYVRWLVQDILITGILYGIWELADRYGKKMESCLKNGKIQFKFPWWLCVLFLFVCWIPAWLSIFPGALNYDACAEWQQVACGVINSHHPVLHVLWTGGLLEASFALTGSYDPGIAVYTCIQMLLLAAALTGTLRFFKEFRVPDIFCFMALLFYGLSPVVQLFAVSTTKDVLFSAVLLLFFMSLIRLYCRREAFFLSRRQLALFGGYAFAAMILRNNGLYIVTVMFVIVLWNCRKYWRKLLPVVTLVCVAYGIYTGPFYQLLHVTPGGIEEMLSVPLQQMARVYKYDRDSLEEGDVELLCLVVPEEYLDLYRPTVSDFVKRGFQEEVFLEHKKEFMDLWIRWGMEHPLTYVNSLLINTVDFWYPGAVVDGYRHGDGRSSYFDYKVDEPGKEIGLLPSVHDYYEAISHDSDVQKKPFAFLVLSPGWYLVMTMTAFGYLWCRKRNRLLIGGALSAVTMLTVLPGPMALVRYVLILYYAFPAVLVLFLMPELFTDAESSTGSELYAGSGQ